MHQIFRLRQASFLSFAFVCACTVLLSACATSQSQRSVFQAESARNEPYRSTHSIEEITLTKAAPTRAYLGDADPDLLANSRSNHIREGMSTEQVLGLFGPPSEVRTLKNSAKAWFFPQRLKNGRPVINVVYFQNNTVSGWNLQSQ